MRLISKKEVQHRVGFSRAHVDRMTNDPEYAHYGFPQKVQIGIRVFFVEQEIIDWIIRWIERRNASLRGAK